MSRYQGGIIRGGHGWEEMEKSIFKKENVESRLFELMFYNQIWDIFNNEVSPDFYAERRIS